jgi:hypothetical protein
VWDTVQEWLPLLLKQLAVIRQDIGWKTIGLNFNKLRN